MVADLGAGMLHSPVVEMQVLAARQSVAEGQVTSAHLEVPVQVPAPSHTSFLVAPSPSSQTVPVATGSPRHVPPGPTHSGEVRH